VGTSPEAARQRVMGAMTMRFFKGKDFSSKGVNSGCDILTSVVCLQGFSVLLTAWLLRQHNLDKIRVGSTRAGELG
jgi:hypothetical protein